MRRENEGLALEMLAQIRDAIVASWHAWSKLVEEHLAPAVLHRATITKDGRRWSAQIGPDPELRGFGATPAHACDDLADLFFGRPRAPAPPA